MQVAPLSTLVAIISIAQPTPSIDNASARGVGIQALRGSSLVQTAVKSDVAITRSGKDSDALLGRAEVALLGSAGGTDNSGAAGARYEGLRERLRILC